MAQRIACWLPNPKIFLWWWFESDPVRWFDWSKNNWQVSKLSQKWETKSQTASRSKDTEKDRKGKRVGVLDIRIVVITFRKVIEIDHHSNTTPLFFYFLSFFLLFSILSFWDLFSDFSITSIVMLSIIFRPIKSSPRAGFKPPSKEDLRIGTPENSLL